MNISYKRINAAVARDFADFIFAFANHYFGFTPDLLWDFCCSIGQYELYRDQY